MLTPRYLVPFRPRDVPHFVNDLLVIGGGLAGLRAANAVDAKLSVLVVTKVADTADCNCSVTDCSLREAIILSNATGPGGKGDLHHLAAAVFQPVVSCSDHPLDAVGHRGLV